MAKFDLYVLRPPEGVPTITAVYEERSEDSKAALRNLRRSGCMVKPLGDVSVNFIKRSEAQMKLELVVRQMFSASSYKPPLSIVW